MPKNSSKTVLLWRTFRPRFPSPPNPAISIPTLLSSNLLRLALSMPRLRNDAPWIGTSWKMNLTLENAQHYARHLRTHVFESPPRAQVFIIPPFTALSTVCHELRDTRILVGAQNIHWADSGPYTGEISCSMVSDCGARIAEIGHSERRANFGETDHTIHLKVKSALRNGLHPLVCVGETERRTEVRSGNRYGRAASRLRFSRTFRR